MKRKNHHWTAKEEAELSNDIRLQGIEVAVANFTAKYGLVQKNVYNKAKRLKEGVFSTRHRNEGVIVQQLKAEWSPAAKEAATITTKPDKIIIMVGKEYMNKLKVEFSEGKLTILYPKEDQLDIKFL
jgi:hypothetical protein